MKQEILHNYVITEIQKYLSSTGWTNNIDYYSEKLLCFLKGVEYALYEKGLIFKFIREPTPDYNSIYYVDVWQYVDPADCWSEKINILRIYKDKVEVLCEAKNDIQ